jgi:carboxymethylenebutenolidase
MAKQIEIQIGQITTGALVALPETGSKAGGVVVTFHREGLDAFTEWKVDQLALAGFVAIAPNHYHVLPPDFGYEQRSKFLTDEQMSLDLKAAADWLAASPAVDSSRLAVVGPCMGGRTALVAAECNPETWKACCIWYGGGVFKPLIGKLPAPGADDRLFRVACPIVGFFGNLDKNPAPDQVDRLDAALTEAGKPHMFHRYADAGHGFLNRWHKNYNPAAADDSWARAMTFLKEKIGDGSDVISRT